MAPQLVNRRDWISTTMNTTTDKERVFTGRCILEMLTKYRLVKWKRRAIHLNWCLRVEKFEHLRQKVQRICPVGFTVYERKRQAMQMRKSLFLFQVEWFPYMEVKIHWIEMNRLHLMKTFSMNQPKIVSKIFMFYQIIKYHQLRYNE